MDLFDALAQRAQHQPIPQTAEDETEQRPRYCVSCDQEWPCGPWRLARSIVVLETREALNELRRPR